MVSFKMGRLGRRDSTEDENQHEQELHNQWLAFGSRIAIRVCLHPFEYAKVLIQVRSEIFAEYSVMQLFLCSSWAMNLSRHAWGTPFSEDRLWFCPISSNMVIVVVTIIQFFIALIFEPLSPRSLQSLT